MVLQNKLNNELYESFQPMLTPKEMIRMGVFGGTYFSKLVDYRTFPKAVSYTHLTLPTTPYV